MITTLEELIESWQLRNEQIKDKAICERADVCPDPCGHGSHHLYMAGGHCAHGFCPRVRRFVRCRRVKKGSTLSTSL